MISNALGGRPQYGSEPHITDNGDYVETYSDEWQEIMQSRTHVTQVTSTAHADGTVTADESVYEDWEDLDLDYPAHGFIGHEYAQQTADEYWSEITEKESA
jgi:hypothetical protein